MRLRLAAMIVFVLLLASLAGAAETPRKTASVTTTTSGTPTYRTETNILYRDATSAALTVHRTERCRLDVHYPATRAGFPTVVWFHGGGFTSGDREKEMLGRYGEDAYLMRMMKVAGHKKTTLIEFPGTDHGSMQFPAFGVLPDTIRKTQTTERD